jgi:hypothetical protein
VAADAVYGSIFERRKFADWRNDSRLFACLDGFYCLESDSFAPVRSRKMKRIYEGRYVAGPDNEHCGKV